MALHQSATALHQPMLAFAGIERDRCGLGPFPTWALIKRYGDTPRSFSYAQLNHRQLYIRGEAIRLAGLAFKWPQGQTYTRHYRIPSTLFLLRIGEIKAVDGPAQTGRKIAAAVKNDPFSLRGDGEERPGYPHIVQSSAIHAQIVSQVSCSDSPRCRSCESKWIGQRVRQRVRTADHSLVPAYQRVRIRSLGSGCEFQTRAPRKYAILRSLGRAVAHMR